MAQGRSKRMVSARVSSVINAAAVADNLTVVSAFKMMNFGQPTARANRAQRNCRRNGAQHFAAAKAIGKIFGNGFRIIKCHRQNAQTWGNQLPVEINPQQSKNNNPDIAQATYTNSAGQPHQSPAAQIRSTGTQCRHRKRQTARAENIIRSAFRPVIKIGVRDKMDAENR